jgi:GTP-binding protein
VDLSADNFSEAFRVLCDELGSFSPELLSKPRLILGTKLDLEGTAERLAALATQYPQEAVRGISVFSGQGLEGLGGELLRLAEAGTGDL